MPATFQPGQVLVGRDVTAYFLTGYGTDGNPGPGSAISMLGRWKKITIRFRNNWVDVSPSDVNYLEKRLISRDWTGTLENQVRSFNQGGLGAIGLQLFDAADLVSVSFTEETSGKTISVIGGIAESQWERGREEPMDTLEIENVGQHVGGVNNSFPSYTS